jgi:hypothetical protein
VAFREQQILETYFPKTLAASGLDWPAGLRERARLASRPGDYQSPVSRHLMVRFTHPQLQGLVLAAWLVFGGWCALCCAPREYGIMNHPHTLQPASFSQVPSAAFAGAATIGPWWRSTSWAAEGPATPLRIAYFTDIHARVEWETPEAHGALRGSHQGTGPRTS